MNARASIGCLGHVVPATAASVDTADFTTQIVQYVLLHHRTRLIASFHLRSSGQGNSKSPSAQSTPSIFTGRTLMRDLEPQTRHQKR
ncbi:hypothetical protein [Novosphingobium gossypii]|uniref:hypothetical protein n=1 Tax=Novosphingobium gossypii TaxID=1604774 RepID=UPI003D25207B